MVEYAIHLYVKRAKAVRLAVGPPGRPRRRRRRRLLGRRRRAASAGGRPAAADGIDFSLGPDTEAFQAEVRQFIAEHLTPEIVERAHATGTMHDWGLHRALAAAGLPRRRLAGQRRRQGRSALEVTALQQELYGSGAPVDGMGIASMVAATPRAPRQRLAEGARSSPPARRRRPPLPGLQRARRRQRRRRRRHQGRAGR